MPDHSSPISSARRDVNLHSSPNIADSSSSCISTTGAKIQNATANDDSGDESEAAKAQHGSHYRFWATVPPSATVDSVDQSPGTNGNSIPPSSEETSETSSQQQQQMVLRNPQFVTDSNDLRVGWNAEMLVPAPHLRESGSRTQVGIPGVMGREHQSRILFVSLLESYCRTYDDDPLRNRRLFFAICRTLYSMGIIGKEYVDEMSSIRATYSGAFRQLVAKAQESLDMYEQHDIETGIRSLMTGIAEDEESSSSGLFDNDHSSSASGWTASDSGPESGQEANVLDRNRVPHCEPAGGSDLPLAANRQAVPILPQQGRSRRNTVSNFGNASYAPKPASHKHSYPRTRHSIHRGRGSYGQNLYTNGGSTIGASSTLSGASGNSAPTTFESMILDMQRSRYHDDFIQLRCLGKGGFGKVFEVRNKLDGRRYAVKQIKIKGEITADKTLREIKTLAHLDHPNIVRYYSSWIEVTRLRKRPSNNSNDGCGGGGSVLGISPQSYGSLSQIPGPRHNRVAAADQAEDCSFSLSTDDDVSFCLTGTQDDCFEMSVTDDGDDEKVNLVEDSALECLDDT
ncbi:hypothetical protein LPJ59_005315, partial [Coemansia sp. RSA 2399]